MLSKLLLLLSGVVMLGLALSQSEFGAAMAAGIVAGVHFLVG